MRKVFLRLLFSSLLISGLVVESCHSNQHFISNAADREKVQQQFEKQKLLAANRSEQLFSVFNQSLSSEESEALQFLYAYMPLSDLADYHGEFYLKHVRSSLQAREYFSWGDDVPEKLFRHFVLPVRVNNETMDTGRLYFFEELKERVRSLSMKEAVLEVNHWCHEKVVYKSTDSRTSGPLNTIKTAYGRCGEESTFTTAALRAVGIPARQCYTPRWAHSDDNHAWVEVWVDGKWHFIGACEPEPDLDLAWFTGPAKRAMLVNTTVYGDYTGEEEVLEKTSWYTKINILSNYTETKMVFVKVLDEAGKPIANADVDFCLYNYAEFFPLSKRKSDANGMASFLTGKGDLMIYARNGDLFNYEKLDVRKTDTLQMVVSQKLNEEKTNQYDLIAPIELPVENKPDAEMLAKNSMLIQQEDSIRKIYTSGFMDSIRCVPIAQALQLPFDSVRNVLEKSCGNHGTILRFLESKEGPVSLKLAYLYSLSEKDWRDISEEVLMEHYLHAENLGYGVHDFVNYVMNPRIGIEMARPYKTAIQQTFSKNSTKYYREHPDKIAEWVIAQIQQNDSVNYYKISISPLGVHELKLADKASKNTYFVAVCRSLGIASRIEPATKKPQYLYQGKWHEVALHAEKEQVQVEVDEAQVQLICSSKDKDFKPVYAVHFSLAVYENGKYKTLDFEESPLMQNFPVQLNLATGHYLLVTGARKPDGSVLNTMRFFNITKNQHEVIDVKPRDLSELPSVIGKIETDKLIQFNKHQQLSLGKASKEKGLVLIWLGAEKEPTKHVLAELLAVKSRLETWGGGFVLLAENEQQAVKFQAKKYPGIPFQYQLAIDENSTLLTPVLQACKKSLPLEFPVLIYMNTKGEILYYSNGYQIGNVEMLEKVLQKDFECLKSCAIPR